MSPLRAALVIARRDYVASVWSRTFLFFLVGPLLPLMAAALFGAVGAQPEAPRRAALTVVAAPEDAAMIGHAYAALRDRLGEEALPAFRFAMPGAAPVAGATLSGGLDAPLLSGTADAIARLRPPAGLVLDRARADRALMKLGAEFVPPPVRIAERPAAPPPRAAGDNPAGRTTIAQLGQVALMFLTLLLTGMTLSNMVEEKSNKVIEVLTAAVPVDGIFFGKLVAMLGVSLTGIAVWSGMGVLAYLLLAHGAALPAPAVGWPAFVTLALAYFCATYLLIGAVFLGIGAQAASVREVQTISMPLTMAQLGLVAFTSSVIDRLDTPAGIAASIFPWSSPYAMLARAAAAPALWPHVAALAWQAAWIALTVRLVSRWFRVGVLKSGPMRSRRNHARPTRV